MTSRFSATQIAIIGAVLLVIADIVALIATLAAFDEEQEKKETEKTEIKNQIKYLDCRLKAIK